MSRKVLPTPYKVHYFYEGGVWWRIAYSGAVPTLIGPDIRAAS